MNRPTTLLENITNFDPFAGPDISCVIHTTQAQLEIWAACQLGNENANKAYNESISLVFKGDLDLEGMEQALQILVQRHESLRAIFSTDGRFMSIFDKLSINLGYQDISGLSKTEKDNTVEKILQEEANHLFNLVEGPLIKAGLIRINTQEYELILTVHHIICDGWSLGVMMQEIGMLYSTHVQNESLNLPEPSRFSAYADANQALFESKAYHKIEQFWLDQYKESVPQLTLPTDYPRPSLRTYGSQRLDFPIEKELLIKLKKVGLQAGCSFVTTLLASFEIFLYQFTGQDNLVVGLPAAGQSVAGDTNLIGHCANLLPLRSTINVNTSFDAYLKQRKLILFDAYDHQQISFGHLLKKLNIPRDASRVPLVPVVFNVDLGLADGVFFEGLRYTLKSNPRKYEIFELFVNASGSENELILEWSYNTSLFKPETIKQMMVSFEHILGEIVAEPDKMIRQITINKSGAYRNLNSTEANYSELPLHELLAKQALLTPHREALKFYDTKITYKNLQQKANQLAHYFYEKGLRPNDLIGVCVPRSSEMVITLIAIMKCGAAYLPMDPQYPRERLQFMLEDSEAEFLITTPEFSNSLFTKKGLLLLEDALSEIGQYPNTPLAVEVSQDAIAYLLYTSGSTGKPKGVQVTHRNLVNLLSSLGNEPGMIENDKVLAITTISFDIAAVELYLPLLKGACTVIADNKTLRDARLLLDILEKEGITILQATPSTWQMLLDTTDKDTFRLKAFCGGEALSPNLAKRLLSKCESVWNMYGPTETTIYSAINQISMADAPICIGRPIANTQIYILGEQNQLVPPGTVGEIVIGGDGVAKGYWKRPQLTADKFVTDPLNEESNIIFYRTGDLGKLLSSGKVQCLGRLDEQVKIRGHRIEPGEIEQALIGLENIKESAVLAHDDRLIAYVVPIEIRGDNNNHISQWRNSLINILPGYLIPNEFRILKALPITPNGKLDRKALLELPGSKYNSFSLNADPRTKTEEMVSNIWQDCLDMERVDIFSNFFELGGHSLIAVQVMNRLEQQTGVRYPIALIFEYSTIEKLAMFIDAEEGTPVAGESLLSIKATGSKIPLYLIHGVGYNVLKLNDLAKNLDEDQPVYGLQGIGVKSKVKALESVEEISAHYISAIQKVNPEGPYSLAGHSYGGIIAYEMASQLIAEGKKIKKLIMLDTDVELSYYHKSFIRKKMARIENTTRKIGFTLRQMSKSRDNFHFYFNRKKDKILKQYIVERGDDRQQQLNDLEISKIESENDAMMRRYHIQPQPVEIDLLRAEKRIDFLYDPKYLGWKDLALNGLNIHDVPGDHLEMILPPNDEVTARILQNILDR